MMKPDKTILVIEDDAVLRSALVDKLKHDGFSVTSAEDGEEGLTTALAIKPDLILLDLMMPKMDGTAVMDGLRSDPWGKNVAVIILTNLDADDTIIRKIVTDQPSYYFMKADTSLEDLVIKIKEVLKISE